MGFISSDGSEHDSSYDQKYHDEVVLGKSSGSSLGDFAANVTGNIMSNKEREGISATMKEAFALKVENERRKQPELIKALINNFNNGNWDAVIKTNKELWDKNVYIRGVRAIAYAKKGNHKLALSCLSYLLLPSEKSSEPDLLNDQQYLNLIKDAIGDMDKLISLTLKAIREWVSKQKGHELSDAEFTQFYISCCEEQIKYWASSITKEYRGVCIELCRVWERKWRELSERPLSAKDRKRIIGIQASTIFKIVMVGLLVAGVVGYIISILPDILALFK
jgi:hypothetical protein